MLWGCAAHEWRIAYVYFWVTDINGNLIWGNVMVRKVNGKRLYRPMTNAEAQDHLEVMAW